MRTFTEALKYDESCPLNVKEDSKNEIVFLPYELQAPRFKYSTVKVKTGTRVCTLLYFSKKKQVD